MKNKILSLVLAVLCVISMIPFTALAANPVLTAVEILDAEMAILEKPWAADGNYTVNGLDFEKNATFDGETVQTLVRDPEVADVTCSRIKDGEEQFKESFPVNIYHYDRTRDVNGNVITAYGAQYAVMEYYYEMADDRATFNGEEETCTEIVGNHPQMQFYGVYVDGVKTGNLVVDAAEGIVANEWATCTFDFTTTLNTQFGAYMTADSTNAVLGQMAFFFLGASGVDLHRGDKFHLKSIKFYSYDPSTFEAQERYVTVYASQADADEGNFDAAILDETAYDLESFIVPEMDEALVPEGYEFLYY
ncbi:MAG: hypothetical protein IKV97_06345, partial [Clostridia bacterium]|nr:hypothetical protein [Clostridia bacterium]